MLEGSCDCGAVRIEIDAETIPAVWRCDCDMCRKLGSLWTYHPPSEVRILAEPGATAIYLRSNRVLEFHTCRTCGCSTHWTAVDQSRRRMGVNARMLSAEVLRQAVIEGPGI